MPPVSPQSNPFAPRQYGELQRVTDAVYIFRNITNSSFVIGQKGVAVVDTQVNRPSAERFLGLIRSVTEKPILYVINTHYHWDHTNGNQVFKNEGAGIISSKLTREFMVKRSDRQREFLEGRGFQLGDDPLLPEITFEGETSLDVGGMPLRLFFAGRAETDDATAVHVVRENVLMSGDTVMTGSFPIFGQPVWDEGLEGEEWIRTIRKLASLKPVHVLPGHGPLAHEAELDQLIQIQQYFLKEVSALVGKGRDVRGVLEDLEPRLPSWITQMPLVWGTPRYAILRVYRALTKRDTDPEPGWQRLKPSVLPAADEALVRQRVSGRESLWDFFKMAEEAREGGDAALQIGILRKACEVFSHSPDAWTAYANALVEASRLERSVLEKGDFFQEAQSCWERALDLEPAHLGARLGKGRYRVMLAYRSGEDPAAGMRLLEAVLSRRPGGRLQAEAEFYLGMGCRRLGDETRAKVYFQKAVESDAAFTPPHRAMQDV